MVQKGRGNEVLVDKMRQFESERQKNSMVLALIKPKDNLQKVSYVLHPDGKREKIKVRETMPL